MRIRIILLVFTQWKWIHSVTISGSDSGYIHFIHKTLSVQPSMRAIIEVDVYYPIDGYYKNLNSWYFPKLSIFTTQGHFGSKCTGKDYGQLGNDLRPSIALDRDASRLLVCENDNTTNTYHCTGNIAVQDFIPRHFSFSFGFKCCLSCSLRGLVYKLRIYGQTNETNCVPLSLDAVKI